MKFSAMNQRIRNWLALKVQNLAGRLRGYPPTTTSQKPIEYFTEGRYYKYIGPKKRPDYFNDEGEMDFVLDGRILLCTRDSYSIGELHRATFDNINPPLKIPQTSWAWKPKQFVEITKMTWRQKLL